MKKTIKIIGIILSIVIGLAVIGLLFVQFSPDYGLFFVKSGSMSPAIQAGDIVVTGPVGGRLAGDLAVGKVITFSENGTVVTHRIIAIDGDRLTTKGDANEDPDPHPISADQVVGLKLLNIPKLGYINSFTSDRKGWFLVIIVPTVILVLLIVKDIIKESLKGSKKDNKQSQGGVNIDGKK